MRNLLLGLVFLSCGWASCQKNADVADNSQDQKLAGTHWTTQSRDLKTAVAFNSDKTYKFSTVLEVNTPTLAIQLAAVISGQWSYNGENIILRQSKLEITNGPTAAQQQALLAAWQNGANGSYADYATLVSNMLQSFGQYISLDGQGNIQLSKEAAKKFMWAVENLSDGALTIKIGGKSIELKKS